MGNHYLEQSREELFITTKLWCSDAGYDGAKKAYERPMKKLGLDLDRSEIIDHNDPDVVKCILSATTD